MVVGRAKKEEQREKEMNPLVRKMLGGGDLKARMRRPTGCLHCGVIMVNKKKMGGGKT